MNYQGKLLVAHPMLNDFFHRAVIFIYQDDPRTGTAGVILNKPTRTTVQDVIGQRGITYEGSEHVYKGGPVNEGAILLLHDDNWYGSNTFQIGNTGLAITSDDIMIHKLAAHNGPNAWRMCMGLSGWHPGQLQKEINSRYGWLLCDADPTIVFAKDGERQWNLALQQCANQKINSYF